MQKLLWLSAVSRRDAKHDGVHGFVLLEVPLEVVRLDGAAGGLVLGVEVEDDELAFVVRQADGRVVLRGQGELRRAQRLPGWGMSAA